MKIRNILFAVLSVLFVSSTTLGFCFHNQIGGYKVINNSKDTIKVLFSAGGCYGFIDGNVFVCQS